MNDLAPASPIPPKTIFDRKSLLWLIAVDALWTVPDILGVIAAPVLVPLCFVAVATPVFRWQKKAGDSRHLALLKGIACGVLAALPFPVCGTAFGAAMLAFARRETRP